MATKLKKEKKDHIIQLNNLECVKGFIEGFITPINDVNKQMSERKRFSFIGGYHQSKEDSYYIGKVLYDGDTILVERIPHIIGSKTEQNEIMEQVTYRVMCHFVTAGMYSVQKAHEEGKAMVSKMESDKS